MYRVYISASTQKENVGVGNYGTEQDRMMQLADRVAFWLKTQNKFTIFRNQPGWTLKQTIDDCNALASQIFIDNHTNASGEGAQGTEAYYHEGSSRGINLALMLNKYIAPLSPGRDRGVLSDYSIYPGSGFAVLRETIPPAVLIEHFYHTNVTEVVDFLTNIDKYAIAEAKAICEYFGEKWIESANPIQSIKDLAAEMYKEGIITDIQVWTRVLKGEIVAPASWLQVAFRRVVNKK
jgi:N-acetylmuramoyl-L-alanine amidase